MRCDRFREEMLETPLAVRTRAERALFVRHGNNCVHCWNWLLEISSRSRTTATKLCYPATMLAEDNQDDEFIKVVNSKEIIEP